MRCWTTAQAILAVLLVSGNVSYGVVIDTVRVGNPGNAPDTEIMNDDTTGYGAVEYDYRIGTYEVTAGQYTEFLNAVAAEDTYELYDPDMALGDNPAFCCYPSILRTGLPFVSYTLKNTRKILRMSLKSKR